MSDLNESELREALWWADSPDIFKWHTWDEQGKTFWVARPRFVGSRWMLFPPEDHNPFRDLDLYDLTPCPVEIDPSKTLRQRPKARP